MALLTDEELLKTLETQLPALLKRHPELETRLYTAFIDAFATKKEVAAVLSELHVFRGEFDQFRSEVNEQFGQMNQQFSDLKQQFSDLKHWVAMNVGGFQRWAGRKLEDVVAGTLRLALERQDVAAENLRLRQRLTDVEGVIGLVGRSYEVDILVDNSSLLVFEVKSVCEAEDVERFVDKVALARWHHPQKTVHGVIVSLAPDDEVKALCAKQDIKLVS